VQREKECVSETEEQTELLDEARELEWPSLEHPHGGELVAAGEQAWREFVNGLRS
jgi:hypothetical protein